MFCLHGNSGKKTTKKIFHALFLTHLAGIFSSSFCALRSPPGNSLQHSSKARHHSQPRTRTTHRNASIKLSTARRKPRSPATQPASQHVSQQHPNQAQQQSQPASQHSSQHNKKGTATQPDSTRKKKQRHSQAASTAQSTPPVRRHKLDTPRQQPS